MEDGRWKMEDGRPKPAIQRTKHGTLSPDGGQLIAVGQWPRYRIVRGKDCRGSRVMMGGA